MDFLLLQSDQANLGYAWILISVLKLFSGALQFSVVKKCPISKEEILLYMAKEIRTLINFLS